MEKSLTTMSKLVKEEKASNAQFRRGYNLSLILMLGYGLVRLGEWVIFPLLSGIPLAGALTTDMLWPLLFTAAVISCGLVGNHKWAGWLSIATALGLAGVILTASRDYGLSLADIFRYIPSAWYAAASALVVLVIGVLMLTSKSVRYYASRRKQMEKELPKPSAAPTTEGAVTPTPAAPAKPKPQHHLRRLVIGLACSTLLAAAGVWGMELTVPPTAQDELLPMEGAFVALEGGGVEDAYQLRLAGGDATYTISSIVAFPVDEFRSTVQPGDVLYLSYEDDQWRNIFELSDENGHVYLTYEQAIADHAENTRWGWGIVLVGYAILVAVCLVMYFRRKKKAGV